MVNLKSSHRFKKGDYIAYVNKDLKTNDKIWFIGEIVCRINSSASNDVYKLKIIKEVNPINPVWDGQVLGSVSLEDYMGYYTVKISEDEALRWLI